MTALIHVHVFLEEQNLEVFECALAKKNLSFVALFEPQNLFRPEVDVKSTKSCSSPKTNIKEATFKHGRRNKRDVHNFGCKTSLEETDSKM